MLAPLIVAVPLLVAAVLAAATKVLPRWVDDLVAIGTALGVTVAGLLLIPASLERTLVHWVGGWQPLEGTAIGIPFVVDPFAAGMIALGGLLTTAALSFIWRDYETEGGLFHALVLVFLGGYAAFVLSGDLFNFVVFLKLMSVAGYALTAHKLEEEAPLQGAVNFTVTNTVGVLGFLIGVGLLYGRTGTLNMAEIGRRLGTGEPDALVLVALTLLLAGLLVKAAAVPFHLWLPDAHAAAPAPVSVLFSGFMIKAGLYGVARVSTVVFGEVLDPLLVVGRVLIALGVVTAVLGAVSCLLQIHLKRLLAFSSVAHVGIALVGIGLFEVDALAGSALYVASHGLVKGALFLAAGVLLHRAGSVLMDELHGAGRGLPALGTVFGFGGLALAGVAPFGLLGGKSKIGEAAELLGVAWLEYLVMVVGILTGAAVLRATARIFLGWGVPADRPARPDLAVEDEEPYTEGVLGHTPAPMLGPAVVALILAAVIGVWPQVHEGTLRAAERFEDPGAYAAAVLDGEIVSGPADPKEEGLALDGESLAEGAVAGIAALLIAALGLGPFRSRRWAGGPVGRISAGAGRVVRGLQSGHVGDYVAWFTVGAALLGTSLVAVS